MTEFPDTAQIIAQTKKWITDVVIGCGFCPFAAKELKRDAVHYEVLTGGTLENVLIAFMNELYRLDKDDRIATSLLILPGSFTSFQAYLDMLGFAEKLLKKEKYEAVYQVASFHPEYLFAGSHAKDPANYTNRSPYPMLHFLREENVSKAIDHYPNIAEVPQQNIKFAQEKGLAYMQHLFQSCMNNP